MISLTCTNCKKVLQIDPAFAGGVCRCQFCGTIQTVPANLRPSQRQPDPASTAAPANPASVASGPATADPVPPGRTRAAAPTASPTPQRDWLPIILILAVGLFMIVAMIFWLMAMKRQAAAESRLVPNSTITPLVTPLVIATRGC